MLFITIVHCYSSLALNNVLFLAPQDAVRNSVCHTATVIANSFMHTGTTSDQFLR